MKKKILGIGIVTILIVMLLVLAGCGNNVSEKNNGDGSKSSNNGKEVALYPVKDETTKKYGYVDNKGKWVIEPKYESASGFDSETGLALVNTSKKDDSAGFINKKGELVLEGYVKYGTKSFHNKYAVVNTGEKVNTYSTMMLIDKDGNTIIPSKKYEIMTDVSDDGIIGVAETTVSGMKYMKLDGTVILEREDNDKHDNSADRGSVFNAKGYAHSEKFWYDKQGNEIKKEGYGKIKSLNDNNYGFVEDNDYKQRIYAIKDGKVEYVTDYIYRSASKFNNSNLAMVQENDYKDPWYLIDSEGKKINNATYKSCSLLLDGKWVVTLEDGKHQVLNPDGSILVDTF